LFGLAGLFGKILPLPPLVIVFGRTVFGSAALFLVLHFLKRSMRVRSRKDFFLLAIMGAILAVHWLSFFYSIQISTVAIGLLTFSTFPLFVTFLEPWFFKEKLRYFDVLTAVLVLCGLIFVVPAFDFGNNITQGAFWGTISGFTFAVLSLLNRKVVVSYSPLVIAWYQNFFAAIFLSPFLIFAGWTFTTRDILLLGILGIFCTALAHVLFIKSLVYVKTQLASLVAGLEPVYGIVFAFFLLGEIPVTRTILGGCIIIGATTLAILKRKSINE